MAMTAVACAAVAEVDGILIDFFRRWPNAGADPLQPFSLGAHQRPSSKWNRRCQCYLEPRNVPRSVISAIEDGLQVV